MGGMHGFGAVVEPGGDAVFHAAWEPRIFALTMLVGLEGLGAPPGGRPTRELMDPAAYLAASYYERWLWGTEQRLMRRGTVTAAELEEAAARLAAGAGDPRREDPALAERAVTAFRTPDRMEPAGDARFAAGDRVRVRRMRPPGHTRCPRYARGATGTVERVQGRDRLPDVAVYGEPAEPEPVYSVAFASTDLFGPSDEPPFTVVLDLWDTYLEPP